MISPDLEIKLYPIPHSVGIARTFIRHHLTSLGFPELVDDACVIASELVTNSIRETPEREIFLYLRKNNGRPLLEVWDASPRPPVKNDADAESLAETGRGLLIAEALATMCGHRLLDQGKITWALLA